MELSTLREEIDSIDSELIALFNRRMDACRRVADIKGASNIAVTDEKREREVIERAVELSVEENRDAAEALMKTLMELSKALQNKRLINTGRKLKHEACNLRPDYKTAIIGLGLMGGSLAYALRGFMGGKITGYDINPEVRRAALERRAVDKNAASLEEAVEGADLVIFCTAPGSVIENMRLALPFCKDGAVLTDICGVKKDVFAFISQNLPPQLEYAGLHPMAGKEVSGFENAEAGLFRGAGFIIVVPESYKEETVGLLRALSLYAGAGRVVVNREEEHDALIAYTSDLMHISASALCADYPENITMAHTAGAFRDCTRVARIDALLWTELFTKNAKNIIACLDIYTNNLLKFKEAMERDDKPFIHDFLQKANDNKNKILTL